MSAATPRKSKRFARSSSLRRVVLCDQHAKCPARGPINYYHLVESAEAERGQWRTILRDAQCSLADSEVHGLLYDLVTLGDSTCVAHMLKLLIVTVPNWRGRLAWEAVRFNNLLMLQLALHNCKILHPEYHQRWLDDLLDLAICQDRPEHAEALKRAM